MRRCSRVLTILRMALISLAISQATAAERFPPPDFTDHSLPATAVPPPRAELFQYLDLTAFALALCGASYLAIVRRSRRGLFVLAVASLTWLGFWREGCICPIGSIQNVTLALCDPTYALPWTVAVLFALPIIFTLFFGRTFCAAVCPLGAVQELVALRPVNVPAWLDQALGLLRYIYLGAGVLFAATGTAFVVCRYDPFVGLFRHSASANMLILGACFLVGGIFVGRPYCRYLCPYGVLLGLCSSFSRWRVTITPDVCIQCRLCEESCPFGAIRPAMTEWSNVDRAAGKRLLAALLVALPLAAAGVG
jgi:NosR/NirI family transcriptional regulator, nitrous oxide reductase regulator